MSPQGAVLESQSDVDALIKALAKSSAVDVEVAADQAPQADLAAYGLDAPVLEVEVTIADDTGEPRRLGPLKIGAVTPDQGQQRFAQAAGRPELFRIKQAVLDDVRDAMRGVRVPADSAG